MFDTNQIQSEKSYQECKPNYEEMAARLKKRIDADKQCYDGMLAGINNGSVNLNREQAVLYHAIIGYLAINIPKYEKEYENMLEKIEQDK